MKKVSNSIILTFLTFFLLSCSTTQDINLITEKAKSGDKVAQYQLAFLYEREGDIVNAQKWYEKSAAQNYPAAQNQLGNFYLDGKDGIEKDFKKAFYWYEKSANNNYFDGLNNLGYLYDFGLGTKKDDKKAITLYESAVSKGSIRAMFNLGIKHLEKEDLIHAYKWLDLARYYTLLSKDMNMKWTIRKYWDELDSTMSKSEIKQAKNLATQWIEKNNL